MLVVPEIRYSLSKQRVTALGTHEIKKEPTDKMNPSPKTPSQIPTVLGSFHLLEPF